MSVELETQQKEYQIGELAKELGTTLRALRFYEQTGLIAPRREGNRRYYSESDRRRLRLITFGRRLSLPIGEIKEILDHYDRHGDHSIATKTALEKLELHIATLRSERDYLDRAIKTARLCIPVLKSRFGSAPDF